MNNYKLDNIFLLRTPLLPHDKYLEYVLNGENYYEQKQRIREVYQNPILQEALYVASSTLYSEYEKLNYNTPNEEENRLTHALMRYLSRMSTRCTPFGLFAGCSLGNWSNKSNLLLGKIENNKRHTRPDMNYLSALAENLSKSDEIRDYILFYPNNSIYKFGSKIRYVDFSYESNIRKHSIMAIDDSKYIQAVLKEANKGLIINDICDILAVKNIPFEDAKKFALDLIDARILISEMTENTTGEEMLHRLIKVLSRIQKNSPVSEKTNQYLETLLSLREDLKYIDQQKLGINIDTYFNVSTDLIKLDTKYDINRLFQTDMIKPLLENQLDNKLAGNIRRGMDILNKLTQKVEDTNLNRFIKEFSERYETNEIPLLEALDVETGIGYLQMGNNSIGDINPLIDTIPIFSDNDTDNQLIWNKKQTFLFQCLLNAHKHGHYEIHLKDEDLNEFQSNWNDLPDSLYVMASITNFNNQDQRPYIHIITVSGSATNILGRFTHCDPAINNWVQNIADQEQDLYSNNTILAEIVHIPESRTGNILMRTAFRKYEIPYLAVSLIDKEFQLSPQDLMLSVRNGELVLYSKKLNKRIIPNLGNAHNYSYNALPVYQFLCDLQYQNKRNGMHFSFGNIANQFIFRPRVSYHNIIFSRATWAFTKKQLEPLIKLKNEKLLDEINLWRKEWNIPNKILLIEGDNELLIDLSSQISLKIFIEEIKNKHQIKIEEFLLDTNGSIVTNTEKESFTNQIVAVFNNQEKKNDYSLLPVKNNIEPKNNIQRTFSIGSEWFYIKIYCGVAVADEILCEPIFTATQKLLKKGLIDEWFFIRYGDPKNHIRIRLHVPDTNSIGNVVNLIQHYLEKYVKTKLIYKIQVDTYQREVERYQKNLIFISEKLFFYDSLTTILFLKKLDSWVSEYRWLYGVYSIDSILKVFGLDIKEKIVLTERLKISFEKEHNLEKNGRSHINSLFTKFEKEIVQVFEKSESPEIKIIKKCAIEKGEKFNYYAFEIKSCCTKEELNDLLASYIHMLINRLFKSKQRLYELVIYSFLFRLYQKTYFASIKDNI